jgi:DNA-binding XRE family transcriptional regulator
MSDKNRIGKKIRNLRKTAGYTQGCLAELSGVSLHTIINIERGNYAPRIDVLSRLADIFGLEIELMEKSEKC